MSDMLGISSGAISAYQRALTTVSNNIANVNTEGYSRQDVVLKDTAPKKMASMYVGTGVMLSNISPVHQHQAHLMAPERTQSRHARLTQALERLNQRFGHETIRRSSQEINTQWQMRQAHKSPAYTTDWQALPIANAKGVRSLCAETGGEAVNFNQHSETFLTGRGAKRCHHAVCSFSSSPGTRYPPSTAEKPG